MNQKTLRLALVVCLFPQIVRAQDSTRKLDFSGSADAYYRYNFSNNGTNNLTSFTNSQNSFELGMATLRLDGSAMSGKVAATLDIGFGRRAEEFSYNDGEAGSGRNGFLSLSNLKQLYISYSLNPSVKLTAGKFATHIGYELLDAISNRNYSMSYLFTNGPFFHTGVKADVSLKHLGLMAGIANYTDQSATTGSVKSLIGQISSGLADGSWKFYLNYVGSYGSQSLNIPGGLKSLSQVDMVLTGTLNPRWSVAVNATVQHRSNASGSGNWHGAALYLNYDPTSRLGLTLRNEWVHDPQQILFSSTMLCEHTLSLNYHIGPITLIPEIRFDHSKASLFLAKDGTGAKTTFSGLMAVTYKL